MGSQVWVIDFGSQYTQLILRRIRELGHSCQKISFENLPADKPKAIILSGGPNSIAQDKNDYSVLFSLNVPILGICYGMQIMANLFGGKISHEDKGEYGATDLNFVKDPFLSCAPTFTAWMSHFDTITTPPKDFDIILRSTDGVIAGIQHKSLPLMGLQFHPEVQHTEYGEEILNHFLQNFCDLAPDWDPQQILEQSKDHFQGISGKILCAFSGGVDSLVSASLCENALGESPLCLFVDHGLVRHQDLVHIRELQAHTNLNIEICECSELFLEKLRGVSDPEEKRKIIGKTFIEVFEKKVEELRREKNLDFQYLLQGTLYPDVIESSDPNGPSVTIKSHHNVGGLPEKMKLKLIEPLRHLFKDEVRILGKALHLQEHWLGRHPFPGPGLGIRVLGALTKESLDQVRQSDQILFEELHRFNIYKMIWQSFTVLLPVSTVGIKGDARAYEKVICLRLVKSTDGMTAQWCDDLPKEFFHKASNRITNEVPGITRVVYDITSKPPGTIEWE